MTLPSGYFPFPEKQLPCSSFFGIISSKFQTVRRNRRFRSIAPFYDDTTDFYDTITLIEDKEPGDKTENLVYSAHVPIPPEIFDNKITIEMDVVHKRDRVLIEYRGYVWVSHIPFEKLC